MKRVLRFKKQLLLTVIAFLTLSSIKLNAQDYTFTQPEDGVIVIEGEHYFSLKATGTDEWYFDDAHDAANFSGDGYMVAPGSTRYETSDVALTDAPSITFKINFNQIGEHYFFAHCSFPDDMSDSYFVALDGEIAIDRMDTYIEWDRGANFDVWGWNNLTTSKSPGSVYILETGVHEVTILMREPGFRLDKIVMTPDDTYTIDWAAEGPAEIAADGATAISESMKVSESMEVYPNPVKDNATITYDVLTPGKVNVSVYSLTGELVEVLVDETQTAGEKQVVWNVSGDVVKGIYFIKLANGSYTSVKKIMLN